MKKIVAVFCLWMGLFSSLVWASAEQVLQSRLAQVDSFYAKFSQTVTSADGVLIQEGRGELWTKRPNLFHWQMEEPDASTIISDGETVWMYTPQIAQVTANWLKDVGDNALFLLIMRNDNASWQHYNVTQQGDQFTLLPKNSDNSIKKLELTVTANGFIASFTAVEQDSQRNSYVLSHQVKGRIAMDKFKFLMPEGATLDDQRQ